MMTKLTYEDLEEALEDGKTVQLCTIDWHGHAVEWHDIERINYAFDVSRFRIVNKETRAFND